MTAILNKETKQVVLPLFYVESTGARFVTLISGQFCKTAYLYAILSNAFDYLHDVKKKTCGAWEDLIVYA